MSDGTTWRTNAKAKFAKASIAAIALLAAGGLAAGVADSHETAATWSRDDKTIITIIVEAPTDPAPETPEAPEAPEAPTPKPGPKGNTPTSSATWS